MRILLLSQSFPPRVGGLETVVKNLAVGLAARGHVVKVVTNRYPRTLPAREVQEGVEVERRLFLSPRVGYLRDRRPDLWLASIVHGHLTARYLRRIMETFRPDVVNLHFPDAMVPFVLRLRDRYPFRLVVSVHGNDVQRFRTGQPGGVAASQQKLADLLNRADAVTACSPFLLEEAGKLERTVREKAVAIHNGLDPARFDDKRPYPHPRPYLLALGRLTHVKGYDLLLRALASIGFAEGAIDLVVAGEGEAKEGLQQLACELGLNQRVRFLGKASPPEVVQLLNGCRFVVIPSREEAFGLVGLEAVAAGKGVVATRVGGMGQLLTELSAIAREAEGEARGENGAPLILVEPDVPALAEGLRKALLWGEGRPKLQGMAATVLRSYSWGEAVERYEQVLAGTRSAG